MFSSWSRRKILRAIALLGIGSTIASIPFLSKFFVNKAQAQAANEVYKNRQIKIVTKQVDDTPQALSEGSRSVSTRYVTPIEVFIDNRRVNVIRIKNTNKYRTYLLPFADYDSPIDLAKALIDARVALPNDPATSSVPIRELQLNNPGY